MILDKPLPDAAAEEADLLGSILINNKVIDRVTPIVKAEHFSATNRLLFENFVNCYEKIGAVDPLTLRTFMSAGDLAKVGGIAAIASIIDHIPDIASAPRHAATIREKALARTLTVALARGITELEAGTKVVSVATEALEALLDATDGQEGIASASAASMAKASMDRYEKALNSPSAITGIDTGIEGLNLYLYGYQRGTVLLIAGRSSVGKTTVGWNLAYSALRARPETRVAYFSLEMTRAMLEDRILSMVSGVPSAVIKTGISSTAQIQKVAEAGGVIAGLDGRLFGNANPLTIKQIIGEIRRLHRKHKIDVAYVDYVQLLGSDEQSNNREREVSAISKRLVNLAKALDIAIVTFAQLNRTALSKDERPTADVALRESDALYHDARAIIMLDIPRLRDFDNESKKDCQLDMYFDKNSEGPRGHLQFHFDGRRFLVQEGGCRAGCKNFTAGPALPAQGSLV